MLIASLNYLIDIDIHSYCEMAHCQFEGRKEIFNDELNTFYLRLYGVGHMVNDHSDSERGNPLPPLLTCQVLNYGSRSV